MFGSLIGKALGRIARAAVPAGVALGVGITAAEAQQPLTPFRYEAQAQRHCPGDKVVWLDFRKSLYYAKGQKRYGQGFDGSYVCLGDVRDSSSYRRSLGLR